MWRKWPRDAGRETDSGNALLFPFFQGRDIRPGVHKVGLNNTSEENRTLGDESRGKKMYSGPLPWTLLYGSLLLPWPPLAFFLYLSFPFPSHLLMRSLAYTCAFSASLSFSLRLSAVPADLRLSSGSLVRVPPCWTEKHAQPFYGSPPSRASLKNPGPSKRLTFLLVLASGYHPLS